MSDDQDELRALLDERGIRKCIESLARGEDRRDAALISAAFWPDAITDFGVFRGNFDEYLAWVVPGSPAIPCTQHVLGQSWIVLAGQAAKVETQVISYHRVDFGAAHHDTVVGGRYLDVLEKRESAWRIASRTMLYDWYHDLGPANNWSQGLMGMAFSASHFAGRAQGDFSETFFGP